MTVKEIAKFTGKTEKTIQRWVIKAADKMSLVKDKMSLSSPMKPADYTIDEVEAILTSGSMSKDAVLILMENARKPTITIENAILRILEQNNILMSKMISIIERDDQKVIAKKEVISLPAPQKSTRSELNQLVRRYADSLGGDYRQAWNNLYSEILYRMNRNIKVCSKNKGLKPIAYMENEGLISSAVSIVIELLG